MCASAGEGLLGAALVLSVVGWATDASGQTAQFSDAVLVRFDTSYRPTVSPVTSEQIRLKPDEVGLVVWSAEGGDRRHVFRGVWTKPPRTPAQMRFWQVANDASTRGNAAASVSGVAELTTQLDPLLLPSVIKSLRGRSNQAFLTPPHEGVVLGTRPAFRRPGPNGQQLRAATAVLSSGTITARIPFASEQHTVRYQEIPELPIPWQEGLPAGGYALRWEDDQEGVVRFTVDTPRARRHVESWLKDWEEFAEGRRHPLYELAAVEYLISRTPYPYLADALDVIDRVDSEQLTPHLKWRRQCIIALLEAKPTPPPRESKARIVGIAEIDDARTLIASGRWSDALGRLEDVADNRAGRARALADLYRGVVHAEWGLGEEQAADFYFRRAIAGLQSASVVDRFRACSNYGNFLLNRAQDRSLDHAFQMAAGVNALFVNALLYWETSRQYFETAEQLASDLGANERASAYVNLARLYAMLADLIAILDSPDPDDRQLVDAERAMSRLAGEYSRKRSRWRATSTRSHAAWPWPFKRIWPIELANLICLARARVTSLDGYVQIGSLAGLEGIERLLGLLELRLHERQSSEPLSGQFATSSASALSRLTPLAEFLRAHVPADRVGRTRAGFFARRSYVNERDCRTADRQWRRTKKHSVLQNWRKLERCRICWPHRVPLNESASTASNDLVSVLAQWPRRHDGVGILPHGRQGLGVPGNGRWCEGLCFERPKWSSSLRLVIW